MLRSAPPLSVVILLDVFLFAFEGSILLLKLFGSDNRYAELAAGANMIEANNIVHEIDDTIDKRNAKSDDPCRLKRQTSRIALHMRASCPLTGNCLPIQR